MRRLLRWLPLASMMALVAAPAGAQADAGVDIRIERDTRPRTTAVGLGAFHTVTLTDRATGQAPDRTLAVFAQATNAAGEQSPFFDCDHAYATDSRVPEGVYNCPVYVDHGGTWQLTATVNELQADPNQPPVTLGQADVPFDLETDQVYIADQETTSARATPIIALWAHVLVAGAWFACVATLALLALPNLRRRISGFGLGRIERRLDVLLKLTWSATAVVVGSGIYLLLNETAYESPFSTSELDAVLALPYARPYFSALGVKLALYALMVLAVFPLAKGARRQLHLGFGSAAEQRWPLGVRPRSAVGDGPAGRRQATAVLDPPVEVRPVVEPQATAATRVSAVVLAAGALGMSLCITLLKYLHQLIESVSS